MEGVDITTDATDSPSKNSGEKEHDQCGHPTGFMEHELLTSNHPRKPWQHARSRVKGLCDKLSVKF